MQSEWRDEEIVPSWIGAVLGTLVAACGGGAALGEPPDGRGGNEDEQEPAPAETPEQDDHELSKAPCAWRRRGAMPLARSEMAQAPHEGSLYLFGGRLPDDSLSGPYDSLEGRWSLVQAYDLTTDTWTEKQRVPVDATHMTASAVDGSIYVFIGYTEAFSNLVYRYEPSTDSWVEVAPKPVYRAVASSEAVAGKIYLIGGAGNADDSPAGETQVEKDGLLIYDPVTDTWSEGASAPGAVHGTASCVLGERIFAFDAYVSGATYIYDTTTDTWSVGAPAPEARTQTRCVPWQGKLLLLGGRYRGPESSSLIQEYDPATDSWREFGHMPRARENFAATVFEGQLFVVGGMESHAQEGPYGSFLLDDVEMLSSDASCPEAL